MTLAKMLSLSLVTLVSVGGCGGSAQSKCIAGASVACSCTNGESGAQSCNAEGGYDACVCASADLAPGAPAADLATASDKRIFVTKLTYSATAGRDACQNAADAAELGGSWTQWRSAHWSTSDDDAIDSITSNGRWLRLDGAVAFKNRGQLGTTPFVPLNVTEEQTVLASSQIAWTGTQTGGRAANDTCQGWTETRALFTGVVGDIDSVDQWTEAGALPCGSKAHVYCIEQ